MATTDRSEALARLAALGVTNDLTDTTPEAPAVERTGDEVYAGGDVARILVRPVHLIYRTKDDGLIYPEASVGDTVLLTSSEAKRLDELGATVDPDASDEELEGAASDDGRATDEQLAAMTAAELVAHVNQHDEDKARVRDLELARPEDKRRKSVLEATADEDLEGENPEDDEDEA